MRRLMQIRRCQSSIPSIRRQERSPIPILTRRVITAKWECEWYHPALVVAAAAKEQRVLHDSAVVVEVPGDILASSWIEMIWVLSVTL